MYSVASCGPQIRDEGETRCATGMADAHAVWKSLLACASISLTSAHSNVIRSLADNELGSDAMLSVAQEHGLLPIVHECLNDFGDMLPDGIRRKARNAFEQHARQALWLTQLLLDVIDLFQRHGIEALTYKGPVLAQQLYGNVALRQYSDIDILVRARDVPRARVLLQETGFTSALPLSTRQEQAYINSGYEYAFHSIKHPNVLELHWRILPRFNAIDFEPDDLFCRSETIHIGGRSVATLCQEDLILVLCVHGAKHAWGKLSWVRDVAQLAQSEGLDWDQVTHLATRLGIQRIVGVTFRVAEKLLRAPVPPRLQCFVLGDTAVDRIAEEVCRNLEAGTDPNLDSVAFFRFLAGLRERPADRLRFWWRLGTTPGPSEWSLVRVPGFLFPLYGPIRVARLAGRLLRNFR